MNGAQVDALVEAAEDGIATAFLDLDRADGGYDLAVPGESYDGLSETQLRDLARRHADCVTEWYYWHVETPQVAARQAFLRWLEGAADRSVADRRDRLRDGTTRTWGQLAVTAHLAESGRRAYQIRHVDDEAAHVSDLDVHTDPADVRDLARHDDRGRYRPLATAPTLATGWVFVDLDPEELLAAVDSFYPATIANWHREREGDLDVTHWEATAARQTGIYDVVDELAGDQVAWLAEACCVDSQCLKRREWDETAEDELGVPRGDGAFPCREPCSLAVAAAREFALAEREESQTYEFDLTPAERDQLAGILDAVADDRIDEVRDGDVGDPTNRYRVRYLRAKRFGDEALDE
ncbi:DR2241 family protein [Halobacteriales archaeon Cl-PHB]